MEAHICLFNILQQLDDNIPENACEELEEPPESMTSCHGDESESSFEGDAPGAQFDHNSSRLDCSLHFNEYCGTIHENGPNKTSMRNQETQTYPETVSTQSQTEESSPAPVPNAVKTKDTASQTESNEKEVNSVETQVDRPVLAYEDISKSNEDVLFYTGIPDAQTFEALFDGMKNDTQLKSNSKGDRPASLRLIDEFFMVLMRLRLGLLLEDLAARFRISVSTCGRIFNKWIDYLDVQLAFLVQWSDRECVQATMPSSFRNKYPNCRVIIDCTEIRTETPSSLQLRSLLYSDYKSHMTYKSLIGISPAGAVTFVSDLYNGSVSDKQITKLSGLVELCEEGDSIMADKGFLISDLTTAKGVHLIIPPFKRKKKQLSKSEVQQTRDIANLRIHVEREMERIKNFRILQGIMPITMAPQSTKIWKLCVRLTNLQPPLVLRKVNV